MAEKQQQIRNSLIYIVPSVVSGLLPIVTLPIFTRLLTKEDYGALALSSAYAVFVAGIANFGLTMGYERNFFESKDPRSSSGLLYSSLLFVASGSLLCCALTFIFKTRIAGMITGLRDYSDLLFWSLCAYCVINLKSYYLVYFKNSENARAFTVYSVDEIFLGVAASLLLVAGFHMGVRGLVFGQLFASTTILIVLFLRFVKVLPVCVNGRLLKDALRISVPLTPRFFLSVVGNQFDKYLLGLLSTLGGVGIYSLGQKIGAMVFTFMTAIQNVFSPQVFRRMFEAREDAAVSIGRYLTPFAYVSVIVGLVVALFAEEVVILLMPRMYHDAIEVISVMAMYYGFMFFGKINGTQLIFMKKTKITSALTIVSLALNVVFVLFFVKRSGVIGAAWGMFLASLVSGAVSFVIAQRYYRIQWEYRKIGFMFLSFVAFSVAAIVLRMLGVDYLVRLAFKVSFLSVFLYFGIRINVISKANMDLVLAAFRFKAV
ncbi:MAG: lipopolysaccharide biosynthesis protein [Candidatus Omnitrophica bacterium]|nr:lipopolysaccharide biosynthesis protein [Candidatus Omnitrophota bacterium]